MVRIGLNLGNRRADFDKNNKNENGRLNKTKGRNKEKQSLKWTFLRNAKINLEKEIFKLITENNQATKIQKEISRIISLCHIAQ